MNERRQTNDFEVDTPPPLAGGGKGEGATPKGACGSARPPPPSPLPQGEGEYQPQAQAQTQLQPHQSQSHQLQPYQPHHPHPVLRLLAWLSPAFPTGAYAYSHGLEWAIETGAISDGDTLHVWIADVLTHGAARNDAILLRHAHRASCDLETLNELATANASSRERLMETLDQGTAFVAAAAPWQPPELPSLVAYPIAVGAMAGRHGIDEDTTTAAYLQTFAVNLISAAVRLVPLGQSTGLRVLAALEPTILAIAEATRTATLDDLGGCAFRSDLAAMHHETQYTRLFRS
jgi:urease accessory protein